MTSNIKCRKCGGMHFTIKCNKNNTDNLIISNNNTDNNNKNNADNNNKNNTDNNKNNINNLIISNNNYYNNNNNYNNNKFQHYNKLITYRVKISELPNDITENEMMAQLYEWGDIIKLKLLNYTDNSVLYIDFKKEDQANYFIKALNKTYFEYNIISVSKI